MPCLDVIMIAFFPRNIQWRSLFAQKARVNTERVPPRHPIILLKSNKFNMAAVSVKRSIGGKSCKVGLKVGGCLSQWECSKRKFVVYFWFVQMVNTIPGRNLPVLNLLTRFVQIVNRLVCRHVNGKQQGVKRGRDQLQRQVSVLPRCSSYRLYGL